VPEVALHDVQGDAGVDEAGGLGVPEAVGAGQVEQDPVSVAQIGSFDELAQLGAQQ